MKAIYTTTVINTGGREGEVHTPDHSFSYQIVAPGKKVAGASNPEQLFAAGYSACFNSALSFVLKHHGIDGSSTITATVTLYNLSDSPVPDVTLGVKLEGHIDGVTLPVAQSLLDEAHTICPYSRATAGNITVEVVAV